MVSFGVEPDDKAPKDSEKEEDSRTQFTQNGLRSSPLKRAEGRRIPILFYSSSPIKLSSFSPSSSSGSKNQNSNSNWISPSSHKSSTASSTASSPCKLIVNEQIQRKQEKFTQSLSQRRERLVKIANTLQNHDANMKEDLDATLALFDRMELVEKKKVEEEAAKLSAAKKKEEEAKIAREEKEKADQLLLAQQKETEKEKEREAKEKAEKEKSDLAAAAKVKEEEELKSQQNPASNPVVPPVAANSNNTGPPPPPQIVSDAAFEAASKCLSRVDAIKTTIKPTLMAQQSAANQIMKEKMLINRTVGQLTRSTKLLVPLVKKLAEVFTSAKSRSPEMYELAMYLAAKKIVKQAEMEVSVKQDSAFPLAILSVHLSSKHPAFLDVLLGRMMKKCPYIVPMYPRKQAGESMTDYQKRLGYNVKMDPIESEIQYGERMCGILSLYAAMVQTDDIPNSHGIEHGWSWFARILNMKPRKLTPLLIHTFLIIAGHKLISQYKDQGLKLVYLLVDSLIPIIPNAAVASTTKLKLFLEETVYKNNSFPVNPGRKMEA